MSITPKTTSQNTASMGGGEAGHTWRCYAPNLWKYGRPALCHIRQVHHKGRKTQPLPGRLLILFG